MKILIIDIETRPFKSYHWGMFKQFINPSFVLEEAGIISFAAKWYGSDNPVIFFSDHHTGHKKMIRQAWRLLNQADAVVHYNGNKFDIPHFNTEFAKAEMTPPSPFKNIDLLLTTRRQFNFGSNKLDNVSRLLLRLQKLEHEGADLWVKCLNGDDKAWERMRDYNCKDVLLTEKLYRVLLPWIDHHPSHAIGSDRPVCVNCGGELRRKGTRDTATGRYVRYVCKSCGRWNRDTTRIQRAEVTSTSSW